MSMKSFDKFCEQLILGEPVQEKAVYDERQKVVRLRNTTISLGVYAGLAFVNTMLIDLGCRWCESGFAAMVLFAPICAAIFFVLCASKGALFDVKGTRTTKYTASMFCVYGVLYSVMYFPSEERPIIVESALSEDFLLLLAAAGLLVLGVIMLIVCAREDKQREKPKQE